MRQYTDVLLLSLPIGGYETAQGTLIDKDITAHAHALKHAATTADLLLEAASAIPPELIREYEQDYSLPRACSITTSLTQAERIAAIEQARQPQKHYNQAGIINLFASFGMTVLNIQRHRPTMCNAPSNAPTNTIRNRFRLTIRVQSPHTADISCLTDHYLPCAWRVDITEV
jgi:hypothetical protein